MDAARATSPVDGERDASSVPPSPEGPSTETFSRDDERHGSRLDDWWARLLAVPRNRALWYWGGPILVTLLAAALRFWNLGTPHAIMFDETYYVKDAWTLIHHGYESSWPAGSDAGFNRGHTDAYTNDGEYVVHPPLGKWAIGLGMALFGAADPFWWRATTALAGTLAVLVLTLAARRLFSSTVLAVVAGLLFAVDGNAIVLSRIALLDNWVMFFSLLGFWFVLLDRDWTTRRLEARVRRRREAGADPYYGPVIWTRPWVVAAGAAFGATAAVKWSGVWFLAGFGLYLVAVDVLARRRAGLPLFATGAILKQGPVTFLLMVPVALVVYIASWTGWFVTSGGYYRHWADERGNAATGFWSWVPRSIQSLWHYHQTAYQFHIGLQSPHPWSANPLGWLLMIRPTNMYFAEGGRCGGETCWSSVMEIGNPLIWWAAALAVVYLVYRLVRYREWRVGLILTGLAVGYLPWLMYLNRTVFEFYSIAFEPYTVLALAFVLGLILGRRDAPAWRRERGIAVLVVYLGLVVLVSAFYYPIWSGMPVSPMFRQLHFWLPSWS